MIIKEKKFLNQIFAERYKDRNRYMVLSGPSFAKEIFQKMPTMVTIAGTDTQKLKK